MPIEQLRETRRMESAERLELTLRSRINGMSQKNCGGGTPKRGAWIWTKSRVHDAVFDPHPAVWRSIPMG